VAARHEIGYLQHGPAGTFYLLPRSPDPDDVAFTERLAGQGVFVLPGSRVEMPGYFRISLTASDDMVERALPVFEAAIRAAGPAAVDSGVAASRPLAAR
jgi:aspartate aminotransferase